MTTLVNGIVVGLDETGLDETGLDETGLDETGLDETGLDETGLDEMGLDEMGLDETGVLDGATDTGVPDGILDGVPEDGACDIPATSGWVVTGDLESVGQVVGSAVGTAVGASVGLMSVMSAVVITSPVTFNTSSTMRVSMVALSVSVTAVSAVSKSYSSTVSTVTTNSVASRRRPPEVAAVLQVPLPVMRERSTPSVLEVASTTSSTNCNCCSVVGQALRVRSATTSGGAFFLVGELVGQMLG